MPAADVKKRKLPKFKSIKELADFFDHTDSKDLEWEKTDLKFERPRMKHVSIRLPEGDLQIIREKANNLGIGHTALIRMMLHQSIAENDRKKKTRKHAN